MATNNITFPIKKSDGTSFYGLVLHNATFDSVVMSLGDKITGDVYYKDNTLAVTMSEYIEYKRNEDSEAVRFVLVNPPTVVREGIVSDNSELRGMTKYSFVFYHPMCAVSNFPFSDVAVSSDEQKYLSNSKTFNWIGNLFDMVAKLNKNLQGTQWIVGTNIEHYEQDGVTETSMWQKAAKIPDEPLSFDKTYVSEVLKTSYETWEIPFVVDQIASTDARYAQGKRFLILFGTPSNEILDDQGQPYIFRFGQGVGLKNNSRTPKNNKIVTRIIGYGSENNIPFGYPQIQWYGDQTWKYTVNNDLSAVGSLPIYKGILGGQYVNLIKHPFTRKTLMPSVYRNTLFNKVSPYMPDGTLNQNFDPTIELVDYYDADNSYVNPVVEGAESVEIHQFEDIKPEFTEHSIVDAFAYDSEHEEAISYATFIERMNGLIVNAINENEKVQLTLYRDSVDAGMTYSDEGEEGGSYTWHRNLNIVDEYYMRVRYTSDSANFNWLVVRKDMVVPATQWDDTMDDDGNYKQSYFKMTLPQLDFDLYACASITEEMKINMRSGACIGCTFDIAVDWDDYKKNFYDSDGNFLPDGEQRDLTKYPKTNLGQVTFVVKKDLDTFGTLMPNTYQKPHSGDVFVILGISLPTTYVTNAEARLDDAAKEYMRENNVHYYEYPLKFDEHFLATHVDILSQIRNNTIVRFQYGGESPMELYVKQMTVKYSGVLPTYDITLTDDVEIVLNQIGQVTDDVSRMRVQVSELQKYYSENIMQAISEKLSKVVDDVCQGRITFQQGIDSIGGAIFHDELRSPDFTSGLYAGHGWRIDQLGNAEFEIVRARSFLEVVELLVNRMQAQEGDTLFTDNDQIDKVEEKTYNGTTYYKLSLKEKWDGYVTSQKVDNIIKGIINTLAAKDGNVSDVTAQQSVESDGANKYYTSWMKVINPSSVNDTVATNQICVILYGDASVPAGKNFKPCELMTIARCGCDADPEASGLTPAQKADIEKRQRVFSISTTDGRIAKLRGVRTPILQPSNYGTTLGTIPDFIRQWSISSRLIANRDYLYAQGIIVGDFIKVDAAGEPITNYVDCGNWQDNTPYLHNEYNSTTLQWETSDVWHNGSYWRCKVTQPYNNVYYEPTDANGLYWEKLLTSGSSAFVVDLNNQMTSVQLDAEGSLMSAFSAKFNVRAYYGATPVISECSVTATASVPNATVSYDSTTHDVTVSMLSGASFPSGSIITVTVTVAHSTHGTRAVTFTIAGTKNSAVYELVPSIDTISFARTNAGGLTPASRTITLNVQKTEAGVTSTRNINGFSGLTCRWDVAAAPMTAADGNAWGSSPSPAISGITWSQAIPPDMIVANSLDATNIYVSIFKGGVLLDTETIPVVKDGSRMRDVSIFKWLDDKPDTPTSTDIPPSNWALTSGRPANVSVGTTWKIENVDDEQKKLVHVVFFTTKPNAKLVLRGTAYSEEGCDFLVLGYLDDNALYTTAADTIQADCENGNTTYGESVSGDGQSIAKTYTIASEGRHSIYLCFVKDGSASEHGDYGIVESIETDGIQLYSRLWRCIGSVKDDDTTITGTWSNPVLVSGLDGEDGENGISAPYYFQEWFAWSDTPSTSDVDTSPFIEPYNGWQESIPTQDATYLWRKSVRYVLNASTNTYSADNPQYFRMSGTNGTSINIKNNISRAYQNGYNGYPQGDWSVGDKCISNTVIDSKPKNSLWEYRNVAQGINAWVDYATASDGDAFTINHGNLNGSYQSSDVLAGHLVQWSQEANAWLDLGQFKGQSGTTYYAHIVWAEDVVYSGGTIQSIIGYAPTKSPNDTTHLWMGTYVDRNSSDPTSGSDPLLLQYTWSYTKGAQGDGGAIAHASTEKISVPCNVDGSVSAALSVALSFSMKVGEASATNIRVNNPTSLPQGVTYAASQQSSGTITISTSATATGMAAGVTFTVVGTYDRRDFTATVTIALIGAVKGSTGSRGKIGRFFYFGGTFDSTDTSPLVVNDAQVPYFEHIESGQKRYHVYNPETTPASGEASMEQMWAASGGGDWQQGSWNNAPWEVMTNDFKYLISEAIFAQFAQFGSAIISGDWMLSKHGLIYDKNGNAHTIDTTHTWTDTSESPAVTYNADNAYTLFDVNNPYSSVQGVNNFVSCYSIDMLTGEGSYGCDKVHFGKDGSGWVANKNISWDANGETTFKGSTKSPFVEVDYQSAVFWNASHDNYGTVLINTAESRTLPTGLAYSGRRMVVVNGYWGGQKSSNSGIGLNPATGDKLFNNTVNGQDGQETTTGVYLAHGECIELLGYGDDTTFYGWIILRKIKIYSS